MTNEEAETAVAQWLEAEGRHDVVVIRGQTRDLGVVWAVAVDSATHAKTGDDRDLVFGLAPLLVEKETSAIYRTGTGQPTEFYVQRLHSSHREAPVLVRRAR